MHVFCINVYMYMHVYFLWSHVHVHVGVIQSVWVGAKYIRGVSHLIQVNRKCCL